MTMVSSGQISLGGSATSGGLNQSVNIELGRSATATISLGESAVRTLAGVASGAISLSNLYGKSNTYTIEYLVVGGGGAGVGQYAGGAGGYNAGTGMAVSPGTAYSAVVGAGGTSGPANGVQSSFNGVLGGGGNTAFASGYGGSGGGGGTTTPAVPTCGTTTAVFSSIQ